MRPCDRLLQAVQLVSIASLPVVAITRRYKELAKQLHPDKWGGSGDLPECILSSDVLRILSHAKFLTETFN